MALSNIYMGLSSHVVSWQASVLKEGAGGSYPVVFLKSYTTSITEESAINAIFLIALAFPNIASIL